MATGRPGSRPLIIVRWADLRHHLGPVALACAIVAWPASWPVSIRPLGDKNVSPDVCGATARRVSLARMEDFHPTSGRRHLSAATIDDR